MELKILSLKFKLELQKQALKEVSLGSAGMLKGMTIFSTGTWKKKEGCGEKRANKLFAKE